MIVIHLLLLGQIACANGNQAIAKRQINTNAFDEAAISTPKGKIGAVVKYGADWLLHRDSVESLAVAPIGNLVATTAGGRVNVWDLYRKKRHDLSDSLAGFSCVQFSQDGQVIAGGVNSKGVLAAWTGPPYRLKWQQDNISHWVKSIAICSSRSIIAAGTHDGAIVLVSLSSGKILNRWRAHRDSCFSTTPISNVAWSSNGILATTGCGDYSIRTWTVRGEQLGSYRIGSDINCLGFTSDPTMLLCSTTKGIHSVNLSNGKIGLIKSNNRDCHMFTLSPSKSMIAISGTNDWISVIEQNIERLSVANGVTIKTNAVGLISNIAWSPSEDCLFYTEGAMPTIRVASVDNARVISDLNGHLDSINCILTSDNNDKAFFAGEDGRLTIWKISSGKMILTRLIDGVSGLFSLSLSTDNKILAMAAIPRKAVAVSSVSGKIIWELSCNDRISSIKLIRNNHAIILMANRTLQNWDIVNNCLLSQVSLSHPFSESVISPGGKYVAAYWPDRGLSIYSVRDGKCHFDIPNTIQQLPLGGIPFCFSSDDEVLYYADRNNLYFLDVATKQLICHLRISQHCRAVNAIAASRWRSEIAVGSTCGQVLIIDGVKRSIVAKWKAHDSNVRSLSFANAGYALISADSFPVGILWDLNTIKKLASD